jgi:putative oxidoreductase
VSIMSIPGRVARPLLASIFISSGFDAVQHPDGKVKAAEKVTGPLAERVSALPGDTANLVRFNGAVQVAAGALLSFGILRRSAALALIGSLVPTTIAGHRFWEELDDGARAQQLTQFLKNLGLLGGLVLLATEGSAQKSRRASTATHGGEGPTNTTR